MRRLYLHIGHFKTGTSAIQAWCSSNADKLHQKGLLYPATTRSDNNPTTQSRLSLELFRAYGGRVPGWYKDKTEFETEIRALLGEAAQSPTHDLLISSEEFWRLVELEDAASARQHLLGSFKDFDVRVILCWRDPFEWLKSWYNQAQKAPHYMSSFFDYLLALPDSYLDPSINFDFWSEAVGKENVLVQEYSASGQAHIQQFLALCDRSSLEVDALDEDPNPALDLAAMERARLQKILRKVPLTRAGRLYHPKAMGDEHQLLQLAERLERLSRANRVFYKEHLDSVVAPVTLEKIIAYHHQVHSLDQVIMLTRKMLRSSDQLVQTLEDAAGALKEHDPGTAGALARAAERLRQE